MHADRACTMWPYEIILEAGRSLFWPDSRRLNLPKHTMLALLLQVTKGRGRALMHVKRKQVSLAYCPWACCRYLSQVKETSATEGMRLLYEMGDNARDELGTAGGIKKFIDVVRAALVPAGLLCSACPCSLKGLPCSPSATAGRVRGLAAELLRVAAFVCCLLCLHTSIADTCWCTPNNAALQRPGGAKDLCDRTLPDWAALPPKGRSGFPSICVASLHRAAQGAALLFAGLAQCRGNPGRTSAAFARSFKNAAQPVVHPGVAM